MRKIAFVSLCTFISLLAFGSAIAERPFDVDTAWLLPGNMWTVSVGAEYRDEARDFGQPPRDHQMNAPQVRFAYGLGGRAEIQLEGDAWRFAEIDGNSVDDAGDWTLSTKIRFGKEDPYRQTALAGFFSVKLPNASNEDGLGTDETDVFLGLLGSYRIGNHARLRASATLGILGDPTENAAQNDVGIFGLAWLGEIGPGVIGVELTAQTGPADADNPAALRLSWSRSAHSSWQPFVAVAIGLNDDADSKNLELGVRFLHR